MKLTTKEIKSVWSSCIREPTIINFFDIWGVPGGVILWLQKTHTLFHGNVYTVVVILFCQKTGALGPNLVLHEFLFFLAFFSWFNF